MIATYLVHHGYCATAEAFARSTGQEFGEEVASIKNRQRKFNFSNTSPNSSNNIFYISKESNAWYWVDGWAKQLRPHRPCTLRFLTPAPTCYSCWKCDSLLKWLADQIRKFGQQLAEVQNPRTLVVRAWALIMVDLELLRGRGTLFVFHFV